MVEELFTIFKDIGVPAAMIYWFMTTNAKQMCNFETKLEDIRTEIINNIKSNNELKEEITSYRFEVKESLKR